jgi:aryl-alcohol dehydrogenase-like predicted oxidoreductase
VRAELAPGYSISRIVKGGWQLAEGHGAPVEEARAIADMKAFVDSGITTFDCADIYTGVEERIGQFAENDRRDIQVHTKYVPDLGSLSTVSLDDTRAIVRRSCERLRRSALDLVQFHWWDYAVDRYVEVGRHLDALRGEGSVHRIGITNFDTKRLRELLDANVPVVSHQVQYSLVDRRPSRSMAALCAERGVRFLCYGSLLGGFLSERWLGAAEPAWVLAQPNVSAAIVGSRNAAHLAETVAALSLRLEARDLASLDGVFGAGIPGDVYELERDRTGRHGRIMKYNLNQRS